MEGGRGANYASPTHEKFGGFSRYIQESSLYMYDVKVLYTTINRWKLKVFFDAPKNIFYFICTVLYLVEAGLNMYFVVATRHGAAVFRKLALNVLFVGEDFNAVKTSIFVMLKI